MMLFGVIFIMSTYLAPSLSLSITLPGELQPKLHLAGLPLLFVTCNGF